MPDLPADLIPTTDPRFAGVGIRSLAPVPGADLPPDAMPAQTAPARVAPPISTDTVPTSAPVVFQNEMASRSGIGTVLKQMGYDLKDGFSDKNLELSPESKKFLTDSGVLWDTDKGGPPTIANAFGQGVLLPLATAWNATAAAMQTIPHMVGDAAVTLGVPKDIVSMISRQDQAGSLGSLNKLPVYEKDAPPRPEVQGVVPPDLSIPITDTEAVSLQLEAARSLRVLQPDTPTIVEGTPLEASGHAMNLEEPVKSSVPAVQQTCDVTRTATDKAGNIRLDLIAKPDSVLDVIRRAAWENHGYQDARAGDIPLAHLEAVADVMGTTVRDLNITGIGRSLQNDHVLRTYVQAMIQSAEEVAQAHADTALNPSDENMMKQLQLEERHAMIQEQVSGLTSEAGRTLRVLQEFGEGLNKAKKLGEFVKENLGTSPEDIRARAEMGATLDPRTQLPKWLNASRKPDFMDKFMYYYTNALVSGPFTHAAYALSNATFMAYEAAVVNPISATIGLVTKNPDRAFYGEGVARLYGMVAGTPDAFYAAVQAAKNGYATALPGQITPGTMNPYTRIQPIGGPIGKAIGVPGNVASAIHTFYNFLGYRASLEAQGYSQAVKDGYSPFSQDFWTQQKLHAQFPQDAEKAFDIAVKEGQRGTFTAPLGPSGQSIQRAIKDNWPLRLIFPFTRVPGNIAKAVQEGTPLAFLSEPMRDNLTGKNGAAARDTQWARLVGGSAIMATIAHWTASDLVTGDGPQDPKQRAEWLLTHQPNSVSIGGNWVSYNKFGSIAALMNIGANLHDAGRSMTEGEYGDAAGRVTSAAAHWMEDTAGLMSLANLIEMMHSNGDQRKVSYAANLAGGFLPYSSFLRQTGSMLDPQMRDTKAFTDALQNNIPFAREHLYPLRDWTGSIVPNPRSGFGSIMATKAQNNDPVDREMQHLNLWPRKPPSEIEGVKLTQEQYDKYQSVAGMLTREHLESLVKQDSWYRLNDHVRTERIESVIKSARTQAAVALKLTPGSTLIQDGIKLRLDEIRGNKPKPNTFERP